MYRPNPFKLSTLHTWIKDAVHDLEDKKDPQGTEHPDADQVMKHIHKHQPGVLFSVHWFRTQYKKYIKNVQTSHA